MGNYLVGFSVYTLAMIGIIFLGFVVVKKCSMAKSGAKSHNNFLEIETSLSLEPRKTIHVIRAGQEKILLATDSDRTTFLAKLGTSDLANVVSINDWKKCQDNNGIEDFSQEECEMIDISSNNEPLVQKGVFKDLMARLKK